MKRVHKKLGEELFKMNTSIANNNNSKTQSKQYKMGSWSFLLCYILLVTETEYINSFGIEPLKEDPNQLLAPNIKWKGDF